MLRVGCIILTVWGGVQFLGSILSLGYALLAKYPPLLKVVMSEEEIAAADTRIYSVARFADIMLTSCATAFSALAIVIVWSGLHQARHWAFWALLLSGLFYQVMYLIADTHMANRVIIFNLASLVVFVVGIALAGYAVLRA
jgi:hypothetical protein